jgi:hypothetical protein
MKCGRMRTLSQLRRVQKGKMQSCNLLGRALSQDEARRNPGAASLRYDNEAMQAVADMPCPIHYAPISPAT